MKDWIDHFRTGARSLSVSHVWRGYASALFLEIGTLNPPTLIRRDGNIGVPTGEFGIMMESSWRIESEQAVVCGSGDQEGLWQPVFHALIGQQVVDIDTFGRLPELQLRLSGGLYVVSFMDFEGDPGWALFDRREEANIEVFCRAGEISSRY